MIVEMRTYRIRTGQLPVFLEHMAQEGMAIERPILGDLVGFYTSEIGPLNRVVHLWRYPSFEARTQRRAELARSAAWQAFVPKVLPLIEEMDNAILTPTRFSPA